MSQKLGKLGAVIGVLSLILSIYFMCQPMEENYIQRTYPRAIVLGVRG